MCRLCYATKTAHLYRNGKFMTNQTISAPGIGSAENISTWLSLLPHSTVSKLFELLDTIENMRKAQNAPIYPKQPDILNALATVHPHDLKCVIIGQDPYISPNQAMGLAFSVPNQTPAPPSLANILTVLANDCPDVSINGHDLTPWTRQGVMLLNTTLTVNEAASNSHKHLGWETITQDIIKTTISFPQPIVYLLWGRHAHTTLERAEKACNDCFIQNKFAQRLSHPSPLGCHYRGKDYAPFKDSHPFSYANKTLIEHGSTPIDWSL